jgi:hypothetical protein
MEAACVPTPDTFTSTPDPVVEGATVFCVDSWELPSLSATTLNKD